MSGRELTKDGIVALCFAGIHLEDADGADDEYEDVPSQTAPGQYLCYHRTIMIVKSDGRVSC